MATKPHLSRLLETDMGSSLAGFLEKIKRRMDRRLDELLPPADLYPTRVHKCMRYSVLDGGKRVRPALMAAVGEALGLRTDDLLSAMCAVEMIHVCSLILDDLPSMDDAEMRHGRRANHLVYGEATAILASIALLNQAYAVLSDSCRGRAAVRKAVIDQTATMVGTRGMIAGQIVDLEAGAKAVDDGTLEYIESHKTGALIVGAVRIAALLSGAKRVELKALTVYARNVGVAYQIGDDILHLTRAPRQLGKVARRDEAAVNYARIHGIDAARRLLERFTAGAVDALKGFDGRADRLRSLARHLAERAF
jgi:geranylgeranyl diphosphate synthase, type II